MTQVPPTPQFPLRLPLDLRERLEAIARAQHRSLANLIVHILREWLAAQDQRHNPEA